MFDFDGGDDDDLLLASALLDGDDGKKEEGGDSTFGAWVVGLGILAVVIVGAVALMLK